MWTVSGSAILAPTGINMRIDWGRSFFSNVNSDVTARLRSGISCKRGRTINSAILGRTGAGVMQFQLDNHDGLYDLENTNSVLNDLIQPGIIVQLRDGRHPLWTGVLDSIPTRYDDNAGEHRATVTAYGIYSTLREAEVSGWQLGAGDDGTSLLHPLGDGWHLRPTRGDWILPHDLLVGSRKAP